jgi:PIN domain nuclease of toxin-antitoxin system
MRILIDTNALIWFANGESKLSKKAIEAIENPQNVKIVSVASIWEMAIKKNLGKLDLSFDLKDLPKILINNGIELLNIEIHHALFVEELELHHRDPFDRIIIAQALTETMEVVSVDEIFDQYFEDTTLKRIW